jgi:YidC/Oxa1 family membrane protein insertase
MGGCIQLLIQFPILMALYGVFQRIPIYIESVKVYFMDFLGQGTGGIMDQPNFDGIMNGIYENKVSVDWNNVESTIVAINSFTADQWDTLKNSFASLAPKIAESQAKITDINTCFGVNMSQIPTFSLSAAALIPILAGITQYLSVKIAQDKSQMDNDNPAAASMKMMTLFMPLMSAFIGFSVPAGLGIYWIATAVIQTIIQIIINRYYDKIGTDEIIRKNVEKRNKKREKKGLPPEKIAKNATASTKKIDQIEKNKQKIETLQKKKEENDKKMKEILDSTTYYKSSKPGSLAEKAGMVAKYNEKNKKK